MVLPGRRPPCGRGAGGSGAPWRTSGGWSSGGWSACCSWARRRTSGRWPPGGGAQAAAAAPVEKLGEGAFKIGGNYTSLAIDMGDHILVVESGQNDARGMAVMAAAKQAIPNKPIRFVVNSHPHFDHASGLAAAVAEGATILTHRNNEEVLERLLAGPRTLMGDSLSKVANRRTNVVEGVSDRDVRKGTNGKVVELHRVANEHSDGMLVVYLPAEKALWSADISAVNPSPAQLGILKSVVEAINRLNLDYNSWIQAHPPNPDRPITKADVTAAAAYTWRRLGRIAPPGQEGWLRDQENVASATETAQTGWLFQNNVLSNHPGASRHPSWPGGPMPQHGRNVKASTPITNHNAAKISPNPKNLRKSSRAIPATTTYQNGVVRLPI